MKETRLANELEIRAAVKSLRAALDLRGPYLPNIWAFYSNKNRSLLTILGDVTFIQAVLLEGDPNVISYQINGTGQDSSGSPRDTESAREIYVSMSRGKPKRLLCGWYEHLVKAPTEATRLRLVNCQSLADAAGAEFEIRTERDLSGRMVEFGNWLTLSSAMTRAHDFTCCREAEILTSLLTKKATIQLRETLTLDGVDPALMLAAVANGLANGFISCNLSYQPITVSTLIARKEVDQRSSLQLHLRSGPAIRVSALAEPIPKNQRTLRVPELWSDLRKWPRPVLELLDDKDTYVRREKAIRMYIQNASYEDIKNETGLSESWVRKQFARCLLPMSNDSIYGFNALVKNKNLVGYIRTADPPELRTDAEGEKPGYSGAFAQLLARFSDGLLKLIEEHLLEAADKKDGKAREVRINWVSLQQKVHRYLKNNGLTAENYPFTTRDKGYNAIVALSKKILYKKPIPYIRARHGKNAANRAGIGGGIPSLIQPNGHYQIIQLDFHKLDTVAIVEIARPNGEPIDAYVPRWWLGALVDTFSQAVIGVSDSFEAQTTESCVLDLIESAIAPQPPLGEQNRFAVNEDGNWLPNQSIPSLAFNGWNILKLDRAWAHKSTNVIASLVSTIGCAICFGRVGEWWARALVEHTFSILTQIGVQCLPSTTGSGPGDPRRNNPDQQALKYRFRQDDICDLMKASIRWINEDAKEGNFFSKPMDSLRRAVERSTTEYFPAPLPRERYCDRPTMWLTFPCKVEGDSSRGIAPYVRTKRCSFRSPQLASAWHLIGEVVFLQILRVDMRRARLVIKGTGEIISDVEPDKRWRSSAISWRNFCLIQSNGLQQRLDHRPPEPVQEFLERGKGQLEKSGKGKKKDNKKLAGVIADIERDKISELDSADKTTEDKRNNDPVINNKYGDYDHVFGRVPAIKSYTNGRS